jgi:hypothetical protein
VCTHCHEGRVEDVLVDRLGNNTGEFALLASAFVGEELAQGCLSIRGY